jgi:hypothetical protein
MIKMRKIRKGAIKTVFNVDKEEINVADLIAAKSLGQRMISGVTIFKPIQNKEIGHEDLVLSKYSVYAYVINDPPNIKGYISLEGVYGFFPICDFAKIADKGAYEFYDKD